MLWSECSDFWNDFERDLKGETIRYLCDHPLRPALIIKYSK